MLGCTTLGNRTTGSRTTLGGGKPRGKHIPSGDSKRNPVSVCWVSALRLAIEALAKVCLLREDQS